MEEENAVLTEIENLFEIRKLGYTMRLLAIKRKLAGKEIAEINSGVCGKKNFEFRHDNRFLVMKNDEKDSA